MIKASVKYEPRLLFEWLAVFLSLSFTYFLGEEYRWSWILGGLASGVYVFLVIQRKLYAETLLHGFYVMMAVVGFVNWGGKPSSQSAADILLSYSHAWLIVGAGVMSVISGALLHRFSQAKTPYLDALTTVYSILATVLMVSYVRENWLYWIAIDLASLILYALRRMWPTVILFALYTVLAANAYFSWGN